MIIVDIETTGLDPKRHCMLSLGAVDYNTGQEFYGECSIYHDSLVDLTAMDINGMNINQHMPIARGDFTPGLKQKRFAHELYWQFVQWATHHATESELLVNGMILAGHNIGHFDILFLEHYAKSFNSPFPFSYRTVDLHSLAYFVFGKSMKHSEICTALGLPQEPKPHHALEGARSEYQAFKKLFAVQADLVKSVSTLQDTITRNNSLMMEGANVLEERRARIESLESILEDLRQEAMDRNLLD